MARASAVLDTVERIYAAALTPDEWSPALECVADLVRGNHAAVVSSPPRIDGALRVRRFRSHQADLAMSVVAARVDEGDTARCFSVDALQMAGPIWQGQPVAEVVNSSPLIADREWRRSSYYNEFVRPIDGFYALYARQPKASASFVMVACRPPRADPFGAAEAALLRRLVPHLATALAFRQRLATVEAHQASLAHILDRIDGGAILTDATGRPSFVNRRGSEILDEADGLMLTSAGLAAATPEATHRLRAAIATVAGPDLAGDSGGGEVQLRLVGSSGRPLLLTLLPISRLRAPFPGERSSSVAIFVTDPSTPAALNREAFAETFRLTRRESEIAVLIASGLDLKAIADALGVGRGTVRFHLTRVFDKTDVHTQAALAARLRGFVVPLH